MKIISLLLFFQIFISVLYSQNQNRLNITPGIYQMSDRLNSRGGELLLKPDSSLVFFGTSSVPVNPCFTAATGTWYVKGDTLHMLFKEYPEQDLYFYNSGISYTAESKPSYDSAYISVTIEDGKGVPKDIDFILGKNIPRTKNGKYEIAILANDLQKFDKIQIFESYMHIPDGGYFGAQLALDPTKNTHSIKIKLHSFSEIPIMLSSVSGTPWQFYPYKNQVSEELIFEYRLKLKKEINLNNFSSLMERALTKNPTFKPFLDKIRTEFEAAYKLK